MATTTRVTVTKSWTKLSDGDCTVQATFDNEQFLIAISATAPATDAAILLALNEPVTFAYKTAVWCKVPTGGNEQAKIINVIK